MADLAKPRFVPGGANARAGTQLPEPAPAPRAPGDELALSRACDRGAPEAWEHLVRAYQPRLVAILRARHVAHGSAEEIVAELWGELALPTGGGARTRIGTFQGVCSLLTWLSVIAIRRHIDRCRRAAAAPDATADLLADDDGG